MRSRSIAHRRRASDRRSQQRDAAALQTPMQERWPAMLAAYSKLLPAAQNQRSAPVQVEVQLPARPTPARTSALLRAQPSPSMVRQPRRLVVREGSRD
jgi:hypothetical protein